jgi:hypothetical protein
MITLAHKHDLLLTSYLLNLKRGPAVACDMMVSDLRRRLDLVALFEAASRHWHDARVFVGEINLIARQRPLGWRLWRLTARLLARGRSEPDRPYFRHAHLARQQQHLNERHRVIGRPLQLAARKHARRTAINKNAQQHSRMIRRRSRAAITAVHRTKVEPLDHIHNETRQMPLWKPLVHGWRKQKSGLSINRAKVAHREASVTIRESLLPFYRMLLALVKSDGLLVACNFRPAPKRSKNLRVHSLDETSSGGSESRERGKRAA